MNTHEIQLSVTSPSTTLPRQYIVVPSVPNCILSPGDVINTVVSETFGDGTRVQFEKVLLTIAGRDTAGSSGSAQSTITVPTGAAGSGGISFLVKITPPTSGDTPAHSLCFLPALIF